MPAKDIGIDLGTRNSLVFSTGRGIVLREPSVVIYDKDTEKIRAIGEEARQMAGHLSSNMEVIWPIRRGVIVDYNVMEKMLKYFISQAMGRRAFRKPRVSISVPSGITEIERKAMEEAAYQSGASEEADLRTMEVKGRNIITGLPKVATLTSEEIRTALREATGQIVEAVHGVLEKTPPELAADIMDRGIVLTGGGAMLHGMDALIEQKTGVSTLTVQDAMLVVAAGTGKYAEIMSRM